jgi:hypothetical protein
MNFKLIDFAVFALMFFAKFIGHEQPKQISIVASKNSAIFSPHKLNCYILYD